MTITIISAIVALVVGCVIGYLLFQYVIKGKRNNILETAKKDAEV